MVPGMGHCQGGPGTDVFDKAAAIDQWVESGVKPQSIVASHMTAGSSIGRGRLCVSRDSALQRQRQHGRGAEFPLPEAVAMKIDRRSYVR